MAVRVMEHSHTLSGMEAYCVRAYAEAMEVIPSTLAENHFRSDRTTQEAH